MKISKENLELIFKRQFMDYEVEYFNKIMAKDEQGLMITSHIVKEVFNYAKQKNDELMKGR